MMFYVKKTESSRRTNKTWSKPDILKC